MAHGIAMMPIDTGVVGRSLSTCTVGCASCTASGSGSTCCNSACENTLLRAGGCRSSVCAESPDEGFGRAAKHWMELWKQITVRDDEGLLLDAAGLVRVAALLVCIALGAVIAAETAALDVAGAATPLTEVELCDGVASSHHATALAKSATAANRAAHARESWHDIEYMLPAYARCTWGATGRGRPAAGASAA